MSIEEINQKMSEWVQLRRDGDLFNESIENLDQYEVYDALMDLLDLIEEYLEVRG
ncbi:MAG TPA: hypothetical protein PKU94_06480 [Candidatus Hydrothermia bacterium]|nr:hypothetical protein [Candidatus Hydrothermia bacterium]